MKKGDHQIEYAASFSNKDKQYYLEEQRRKMFKKIKIMAMLDKIQSGIEELKGNGKKQ